MLWRWLWWRRLWKRNIGEGVILGQVYCCGGISVFWGCVVDYIPQTIMVVVVVVVMVVRRGGAVHLERKRRS